MSDSLTCWIPAWNCWGVFSCSNIISCHVCSFEFVLLAKKVNQSSDLTIAFTILSRSNRFLVSPHWDSHFHIDPALHPCQSQFSRLRLMPCMTPHLDSHCALNQSHMHHHQKWQIACFISWFRQLLLHHCAKGKAVKNGSSALASACSGTILLSLIILHVSVNMNFSQCCLCVMIHHHNVNIQVTEQIAWQHSEMFSHMPQFWFCELSWAIQFNFQNCQSGSLLSGQMQLMLRLQPIAETKIQLDSNDFFLCCHTNACVPPHQNCSCCGKWKSLVVNKSCLLKRKLSVAFATHSLPNERHPKHLKLCLFNAIIKIQISCLWIFHHVPHGSFQCWCELNNRCVPKRQPPLSIFHFHQTMALKRLSDNMFVILFHPSWLAG